MTSIVSVVCWVQPALAHDPPAIQPTHLDFDASSAPKNCRDDASFRLILHAWVPSELLREDAERRLVVRIQSSSTGGKRADVSLISGEGVVMAERHTSYTAKMECHKVLWETARDAARVLGAFEPPPPKQPMTCPMCPLTPPIVAPPVLPTFRCPTCPRPISLPSAPRRFFAGLGGFIGSGIFEKLNVGPVFMLGVVPFRRFSQLHLELESSWTAQSIESVRVQSIPLVSSLCWVRGIVRFCGGIATTILSSEEISENDSLHLMFGSSMRIGTELFNYGLFSIRTDVFARFMPLQQSFGPVQNVLHEALPFSAGVAVMGQWAVD